MAAMRAILAESRQRQVMLTAELRPTQATLRVRCGDLSHLHTAATMATTNSRDWIFTHAFSESSFKSYEKNGLARRDTIKRPKLGPWLGVIDAILNDDKQRPAKQRHTSKRIFERLKEEHGFTGGCTIVKD